MHFHLGSWENEKKLQPLFRPSFVFNSTLWKCMTTMYVNLNFVSRNVAFYVSECYWSNLKTAFKIECKIPNTSCKCVERACTCLTFDHGYASSIDDNCICITSKTYPYDDYNVIRNSTQKDKYRHLIKKLAYQCRLIHLKNSYNVW